MLGSSRHADTRDMVIDFIKRFSSRTGIIPLLLPGWIKLFGSKYYQWKDRYGMAGCATTLEKVPPGV